MTRLVSYFRLLVSYQALAVLLGGYAYAGTPSTPLDNRTIVAGGNTDVERGKLHLAQGAETEVLPVSVELRKAIARNDFETVKRLLNQGLRGDGNYNGFVPLDLAVSMGRVEMVRFMLDQGADPNVRLRIVQKDVSDPYAGMPLLAVALDYKYLRKRFAPPDDVRDRAVSSEVAAQIAELILRYDVRINEMFLGTKHRRTYLSLAVEHNDLDMAQRLLAKGADVSLPRDDLYTPIVLAAKNGNVEMVKLLMTHGADMYSKSAYGGTAVAIAAAASEDVAIFFLDQGADPNHDSLLASAVLGKKHALLRKLIEKGVNVNTSEENDVYSHLGWAVSKNDVIAVQMLLSAGADSCLRGSSGMRPYDLARRLKRPDILAVLERHHPESRCPR